MRRPRANAGYPEKAFSEADAVSEGLYGAPVITHCRMESHGSTSEWTDADHLFVHMSTQNVSGIAGHGGALETSCFEHPCTPGPCRRRIWQQVGPDRWGIVTAKLSKKAGGKPVRMMLERDSELKVAGCASLGLRPRESRREKDGTLVAWESRSWGTGGPGGGGMSPIPYCFAPPNQRKEHTAICNNIGPARAWRAPNQQYVTETQ